jgi:biopolymer transport protein ExbD
MGKVKKPKKADEELDLMPIMNLFSILIPFLLSMAVFQKMAIVEVNMPSQSEMPPDMATPPEPDDNALNLTLTITKDGLAIWARGGAMPTIFTKEMIDYRCKNDSEPHRHDPAVEKDVKCLDGVAASIFDKENIRLFALERTSEEDPGTLTKAVYSANDSAYLDANGQFLTAKSQLKVGNVYRSLNPESTVKIDAKAFNDSKEDYRSAYDVLGQKLIDIHNRFVDLPDADNIIILADDAIIFDKVIQLMDVARESGFYNIQLAKLGG